MLGKRQSWLAYIDLYDFSYYTAKKKWLETHLWHTKRMKMIDIWGYRLVSFLFAFKTSTEQIIGRKANRQIFPAILPSCNAWLHHQRYFLPSSVPARMDTNWTEQSFRFDA